MDRFGLSQQIKASQKHPVPCTALLSSQRGSAAHRHLHTEHRPKAITSLLPYLQLYCLGDNCNQFPENSALDTTQEGRTQSNYKCILELMEGGVILSHLGSDLEIALPMSQQQSALIKVLEQGTHLLCVQGCGSRQRSLLYQILLLGCLWETNLSQSSSPRVTKL